MTTLPGCMMPDGAEPCDAFTEAQAEIARLKGVNATLLGTLEAIEYIFHRHIECVGYLTNHAIERATEKDEDTP